MRLTKKYHKELWRRIADLEAGKAGKYFYMPRYSSGVFQTQEPFSLVEAIEVILEHLKITLERKEEKVVPIKKSNKSSEVDK